MSPKSKEQFAEIRQRSRENIMEKALELFGTQGYVSTSISQIAKAAGVSKGLMYNYFESKDELLRAILIKEFEDSNAWWDAIMDADLPPREKLVRITRKVVEQIRGNIDHWKLLTSLAFQPATREGMEDVINNRKGPVIAKSVDLFRKLGVADPVKETFLYGAILDGIFLHYMSMPDEYPLEDMIEYSLQRYLSKTESSDNT